MLKLMSFSGKFAKEVRKCYYLLVKKCFFKVEIKKEQ